MKKNRNLKYYCNKFYNSIYNHCNVVNPYIGDYNYKDKNN